MKRQASLLEEWYGEEEDNDPGDCSECKEKLQILLALLRALHWLHWTTHWQVEGESFYGDHLLFDRMYTAMPDEIDGLAEKIVSYFGGAAVCPVDQVEKAETWLRHWHEEENPYARAYSAEEELQDVVAEIFDQLDESGDLPLGLNDFLAALANAHETNLYLLGQRLNPGQMLKLAWNKTPGNAKKYFFR